MPPVQVPVIKRNSPQPTASVGRVDVPLADASQAASIQGKAAGSLVNEVAETIQKEIEYTADTKSTEIATKYQKWYDNKLRGEGGLAYKEGDPVEHYKKFDEEAEKEYNTLLEQTEGYSHETKRAVVEKLSRARERLEDSRTSLEGKQNADYTARVTRDAVDLAKTDAIDATANLDIFDKNATNKLDDVLNNIRDLRHKEGLKNGTVREEIPDPNDIDPVTNKPRVKSHFEPSVKAKIEKDVSDALILTMDNLVASGDAEGAEFIMKQYKSELRGHQLNKIEKVIQKASKENEANKLLNQIIRMPEEQARAKIDAIKDYDVREQASKRYDSELRRRDNSRKRIEKNNYEAVMKTIIDHQTSGNPFQDDVQLLDDKDVKLVWGNLNSKQQIAAMHAVNQPKDSDQTAKGEAFEALFSGKLTGMKWSEFNEVLSGLNKEDRRMFEQQYKKANTQTPGQEIANIKLMGTALTKHLMDVDFVVKNQYGRFTNDDQKKINAAYSEMIMAMDDFPPNAPMKDRETWIKQFVADRVKDGKFEKIAKAPPTKFIGSTKAAPAKTPDVTNVPGASQSTDTQKLIAAQREFIRIKGRKPDLKNGELLEFMKKGNK